MVVQHGHLRSEFFFRHLQGARHTFGEATGKNIANPTAMFLCAAQMLRHVNLHYYATLVKDAVEKVIKSGKVCFHI